MPVLALIPQLFIIGIALAMGLVILGVVTIRRLPEWSRRAQLRRLQARRLEARANQAAWKTGDDLASYPNRLAQLELQLLSTRSAALTQVAHLRRQAAAVDSKGERDALALRYATDADRLVERADGMARLSAQLWRTRALVTLRVHAAVTARSAPDLTNLPEMGRMSPADVEDVLSVAATDVRGFIVELSNRLADLEAAALARPADVAVPPEAVAEVEAEQARVAARYRELMKRMDAVADDMDYLMERCRTQAVLDQADALALPDGRPLVDFAADVAHLDHADADLTAGGADLGEAILALDEGISALEQSGQDARAHADAALEVERLLERFDS